MNTRNPIPEVLGRVLGYARRRRSVLRAYRVPGIAHRSRDVALKIVARYAAIEHRWPAMALVFQQLDRGNATTVSQSFHTTHPFIFLNPRVLLRMLVGPRPGQERESKLAAAAHPHAALQVRMALAAQSSASAQDGGDADVITRITRRVGRVEQPLNPGAVSRGPRPAPSQPRPSSSDAVAAASHSLAPVFRLAPRPRADVSAVATSAQPERPGGPAGPDRSRGTAAPLQPTVDIARLTDHVMQALDRRIVAQRERMGRS